MNPNQDIYQRRLIRIGILIVVIFIVLGLVAFFLGRSGRQAKQVDPDTGEIVYSDNNTPEKEAGGGSIILLGSTVLTDNGATQDQLAKIKLLLVDYGQKNLANKFDRVALVPDTFANNDGVLTGKLRLGTEQERVDITIKLIQLTKVQVIVTDPQKRYSNYDSGVVEAAPASEQTINNDEEAEFDSGDGVPPEQQPPF